MKNLRNLLFYTLTIGTFSGLVYWLIIKGQMLEINKVTVSKNPETTSSWLQFIETYRQNITSPLAILLLQIITIIVVARAFGYLCKKIRQPTVIGEIAAGIFLGPSFIGMYYPEFSTFLFPAKSLGNLQFLSQIGLILFMFVVGMELDLKVLKNKAQEAVVVSHASIIFPFALGIGLAYFVYERFAPAEVSFLSFALFTGIALSITAFPVLARIVQERGLTKTRLGAMAITCAATDDITAWCILAAVIAIVKAGSFVSSIYTMLMAAGYVLVMLKLVRPFLKKLGDIYSSKEGLTKPVVAVFFIILLLSAYATEIIGIHALFGAFMAGVIMPPNLNFRNIFIEKVEDVALVLLLPLFFVFTGLRTQIGLLNDPYLWEITGLIILLAVAGKFAGSSLAAKFVGQNWRDSLIIGALMNTRGLMELVVLNIGYDLGVLTPEIFAMMVIMALVTTCMTGPALDMINRFLPEKKAAVPDSSLESEKYTILVAFGSPERGKTMLRLANSFVKKSPSSSAITTLHLSPSNDLNQFNSEEYEEESFGPIRQEANQLSLPVVTLFKPSPNIDRDIIETANVGNFDLLLVGIGRSVFEGSILGKLLGFTTKIISPERLYSTLTGKEKFFDERIFGDRTRQIIRSVKGPVGILVEKKLTKIENIFVPIFSLQDSSLLVFAQKLMHHSDARITILDVSGVVRQNPEFSETIAAMERNAPDHITFYKDKIIENEFLDQQDLMLISLESWKKAVESRSLWLANAPSVLMIRA
jgi:Kef-type K+ transport system membrane component KefB